MKKPKFYEWETDKANAALRKRVKKINVLVHKKNKSEKDKLKLKELLEEEHGQN